MIKDKGLRINKEAKTKTYYFEKNKFSIYTRDLGSKLKDESIKSNETIRICLHNDNEADLHNMIICHPALKYIRPHSNPNNSKAYHHIDGEMLMVGLDKNKKIIFKDTLSENNKIIRIEKDIFLFLYIKKDCCVFHEIVIGPFIRNRNTIFATWAPEENDTNKINMFIKEFIE